MESMHEKKKKYNERKKHGKELSAQLVLACVVQLKRPHLDYRCEGVMLVTSFFVDAIMLVTRLRRRSQTHAIH